MGKTNKTKKNSKKAKFDIKAFAGKNKKALIIALIIFVVLAAAGTGTAVIINYQRAQEINTGFYNLSEPVKNIVKDTVLDQYGDSKVINFIELTDEDFLSGKAARMCDLVFAWDGAAIASLKNNTKEIDSDCYYNLPKSERREEERIIPILLDHFEIAYNRELIEAVEQGYPQNFIELQGFIKAVKGYVFSPFFTYGGDDQILLGFISAVTEGLYGYEAYKELEQAIVQKKSLSAVIDKELFVSNADGTETLREVLDLLRNWVDEGLVHPAWPTANYSDFKSFLEDNQVGVLFTTLSKHRELPYKVVSEFDADRMSMYSPEIPHALICPYIVGVKLSNKKGLDDVLGTLVTEEVQANLSNRTHLASSVSRSAQYDRQSDDVRFLAAACKYGPRTDIYSSAFQLEPEKGKAFANEVRNYLRFGVVQDNK